MYTCFLGDIFPTKCVSSPDPGATLLFRNPNSCSTQYNRVVLWRRTLYKCFNGNPEGTHNAQRTCLATSRVVFMWTDPSKALWSQVENRYFNILNVFGIIDEGFFLCCRHSFQALVRHRCVSSRRDLPKT